MRGRSIESDTALDVVQIAKVEKNKKKKKK